MNNILKHIVQAIGLVFLQVLIIDQINFGFLNTYIHPVITGIYILHLPIGISTRRLLVIAFFTGLALDAFHNTLGMNASAMLTIAFIKPFSLRFIDNRGELLSTFVPNVKNTRILNYMLYAGISLFIYHLNFFIIEGIGHLPFYMLIARSFLSAAVALFFAILLQFLTISRQ